MAEENEQRNAQIWSTRVQRELLALTAGGAEDSAHVAELPSFITLVDHELDIAKGVCKVSFQIDIPVPPKEGAEEDPTRIVVTLDASLHTKIDGSVNAARPAYPFEKPMAILLSGADLFPEGSTVSDGDFVDIDCDWTPSLHLSDAVLNVGLKVKESILQHEPFHKAEQVPVDPVDEVVKSARRFGNFLSKSAKSVTAKTKPPRTKDPKQKPRMATAEDINIGDEINLLESPWADCTGVYSCKCIRRPTFVEDAMALAASSRPPEQVSASMFDEDEGDVPDNLPDYMMLHAGSIGQVASAGFAGAGAMFRSFRDSAKSVLEETFLMITDTHIIELKTNRLNLSTGTVNFAISIDMTARLKFRRQESVSLFFKPAPDDPIVYMCPDSASAVQQIQSVLQRQGVRGKHTNASAQRAVNEALQIVQEIQAKERALEYKPSVARVDEVMDLYRQAAERFELAGDQRHEEVMTHMRKFLAMPLVVSILDGSFVPPEEGSEPKKSGSAVPEGEVLERTKEQLDDDDMSVGHVAAEDNGDKEFTENVDNLLKEVKEDFGNLDMNDADLDDMIKDGNGDAIADLDAMLSAADKEINDIMKL